MSADKKDDETTSIVNDETHNTRFAVHHGGTMSLVDYRVTMSAVLEITVSTTTRWVDRRRLHHRGRRIKVAKSKIGTYKANSILRNPLCE